MYWDHLPSAEPVQRQSWQQDPDTPPAFSLYDVELSQQVRIWDAAILQRQRRQLQAQAPFENEAETDIASYSRSASWQHELAQLEISLEALEKGPCHESTYAKVTEALKRIHRTRPDTSRCRDVAVAINLSSLSSIQELLHRSERTLAIFRHSSHTSQEPNLVPNSVASQVFIDLPMVKLVAGSYNIRGLKRFGRQTEMSYLLSQRSFDILGLQETKCTGNTITQLAAGSLLNSSDNPSPGKEEHRGTGLVLSRRFAPAIRKIYQGSSRWCGVLLLAKPVPLLALSVYAPTAAAETEEKQKFYEEIGTIIAENGGSMVLILGDFNAKILTDPGLPRHVGQNIFRTAHPLGNHTAESFRK